MEDLRAIIGTELPLDHFHLTLRRVASQLPGGGSYGSCLVTCSDERQGALRAGFERDVAMPLISDVANTRDRVFLVSNLCGRLEPGAFALVDDHFSRQAERGSKTLLFEISSHVGRLRTDTETSYGQIERFGRKSACCGALRSLLSPSAAMETVRHPWFEQLNAFFGPVRLAALRRMPESEQMVAAAIIHAALQAESAVAEAFNSVPQSNTDVMMIAGVTVNQQWADGFLPVAWYHLRAEQGVTHIVSGFSLRTTPEALTIDTSGPRIHVDGGLRMESAVQVRRSSAAAGDTAAVEAAMAGIDRLSDEQRHALESQLERVRAQVESIRTDPGVWRSYSRPVLRGLFRALCVAQPEIGLAALAYEGGEKLFKAQKLQQLVRSGPRSGEGRRVLHEIEAELQQLNHEDAQQVLDLLLAGKA